MLGVSYLLDWIGKLACQRVVIIAVRQNTLQQEDGSAAGRHLHAKDDIEDFARKNPKMHLFEIGDLDDLFWLHTIWYCWRDGNDVRQLVLVYTALAVPVLLANADPPREQICDLIRALLPLLPRRLYSHVAPDAAEVLAGAYDVSPHGLHWKMGLVSPTRIAAIDTFHYRTDKVLCGLAHRFAEQMKLSYRA